MCAECGMNPCHPRCPNAPEPVPVHECVKCGYGILAGDKFWDSPEGKICEECVDDMSAEEILKSPSFHKFTFPFFRILINVEF
mgnify:CR=1 FL=1